MGREYIRARIRKSKDQDILNSMDKLISKGNDEADIVRAALRFYFDYIDTEEPIITTKQPAKIDNLKRPVLENVKKEEVAETNIDRLLGMF